MLLFLGDLGGREVFLILAVVGFIPLALLAFAVWRLVRPLKPPVNTTLSVAEELQKLQALRVQGVLTEAEFAEQKRRLLQ